jgi:putative transposase
VVSALHAHSAFVTRYRHGLPGHDMLRLCEKVTRKACAGFEAGLREFDGGAGHVHPLANYPSKVSGPALVNSLKGFSTRMPRSQYTGKANRARMNGHSWSRPTSPPPAAARRCRSSAVHRAAAAPGLTAGPGLTPP